MPNTVNSGFLDTYMKVAQSRATDILLWILANKDNQNHFYLTLESIAESCNATKVTVNTIFQRLYKAGFLKKICNGHYALHPRIAPTGSEEVQSQALRAWMQIKN